MHADATSRIARITADGLADAMLCHPGPVAVWVELRENPPEPHDLPWLIGPSAVLHIGPPDDPAAPPCELELDFQGHALIPGLVNAHCHLDLTLIGPRPHDPGDGFVPWVEMVIRERPTEPAEIERAVVRGVDLSLAGGVVAVGDILGAAKGQITLDGYRALRRSPLHGVGFAEVLGIGTRAGEAEAALRRLADGYPDEPDSIDGRSMRLGLQPHAPNTVARAIYARCAEISRDVGVPLATHLAETLEERAFIADAAGPQRELLERLGIWDDAVLQDIGHGRHPIELVADATSGARILAAHVNDLPGDFSVDRAEQLLRLLQRHTSGVAYCPRASDYFGAPGRCGPHRYRDMLDAGVNVCLGTDSIINLDTPDRISPLDDARLLHRRDGTDPGVLLDMMTRRGARALGLDADLFTIQCGGLLAGLVAVPINGREADPRSAVLRSDGAPRLLFA